MPTWNELFLDKEHIKVSPQTEIIQFIHNVKMAFPDQKTKIWDQCCGGGRHTIAASKLGCDVYSTDVAFNGISNLEKWLKIENLHAICKIADMTEMPWPADNFHGVMCWDALHHNTIENIRIAVNNIHQSLVTNGFFICTLISTKSGSATKGKEVEKNTFVDDKGNEAGVLHHYFNEEEILNLFADWKKIVLAEKIVRYLETSEQFYKTNPFAYTKWELYLQKQ
jgi:2-polyprenyl-3-methyl-5-hydroxy-6-metoxy-1,4-benzoquinol methylase